MMLRFGVWGFQGVQKTMRVDWTGFRPIWWRMNHAHASIANVQLQVIDDGTPIWFAKHNIHPEEELRWEYGDHVPKAWNRPITSAAKPPLATTRW